MGACNCMECQAERLDLGLPKVIQELDKPKVHEFFTNCECDLCNSENTESSESQ